MFIRAIKNPLIIIPLLLIILVTLVAILTIPFPTVVKVFTILSSAASFIMVFVILKTYKKERLYKKKSYIITAYTCLFTLAAYSVFYSDYYKNYFVIALVSFFVGIIFGAQWSKSTKLYLKKNNVYGQNSAWWLLFWAFSFGITQSLSQLTKSEGFYISIILTAFTSGNSIGFASGIIKDINEVLSTGKLERKVIVKTNNLFCPNCKAPLGLKDKHCGNCGLPVN